MRQSLPILHLLLQKLCADFLLARSIHIYHPLLNEPHSSTIDHFIPLLSKPISCKSVTFQHILISSFVQFFMVLLHIPSLIFKKLVDSRIKWAEIHFPHVLNENHQNIM